MCNFIEQFPSAYVILHISSLRDFFLIAGFLCYKYFVPTGQGIYSSFVMPCFRSVKNLSISPLRDAIFLANLHPTNYKSRQGRDIMKYPLINIFHHKQHQTFSKAPDILLQMSFFYDVSPDS